MTFTAYIQRQKSLIRSRREVEPYSEKSRHIIPEYDTETLFGELSAMKGLNTAEREQYYDVFSLEMSSSAK